MALSNEYLGSQLEKIVFEGLKPGEGLLSEIAKDLIRYRSGDLWIPVGAELPPRPENGFEASEDVIAATIADGKILRWDRVCCTAPGKWARDGIIIQWTPTHWHPLPSWSVPLAYDREHGITRQPWIDR